MMEKFIVVESAAKTKTIRRFLAGEYEVIACGGHIVDLPDDELGIDVEDNFSSRLEPIYFRGQNKVERVREQLAEADEIYLATDPDREGEAIAADLFERCLPGSAAVKRIEFNAIVYRAVKEALENPREIDENRVEAQRARRVLDRLIGFIISAMTQFDPAGPGLPAAGRVMCPAVSLVVDREDEIEEFTSRRYWKLHIALEFDGDKLEAVAAEEWEDFEAIKEQIDNLNQHGSMQVQEYEVDPEDKLNPPPPYTTDSLQADADELLGFTPEMTMSLAQELYQGVQVEGKPRALITYMRTDSTRVSPQALNQAKEALNARFDSDLYKGRPWKPRGAEQDAHEAIRPTAPEEVKVYPENLKEELDEPLWELYNLIYFRFLSSQARPARYETTKVELSSRELIAAVEGHLLENTGFLQLYRRLRENYGWEETEIPGLNKGDSLGVKRAWPEPEQTYPPPRYREGSLVSELKNRGIGRPSTYGNILAKIKKGQGGFGYVRKVRGKLRPTDRGHELCEYLRDNYRQVISYEYTARMEEELDRIEAGESSYEDFLAAEFNWLEEPYKQSQEKNWLSGDRPTPAQLKYLKSLGRETNHSIPEDVLKSKGKTSEWIEKLQDKVEPVIKLSEIEEVEVGEVDCYRFKLSFNRPLPDEEKEFLKEQKMKYRRGSEDQPPSYQFQRQDYETVTKLRKQLKKRYSPPTEFLPEEFELKV